MAVLALTALVLSACNTGDSEPPAGQRAAPLPGELSQPNEARRNPRRVEPVTPYHKREYADQLVRIAILLPLSSSSSAARAEADSMLKAAQLALFTAGHANMVLLPKDTGGSAPGARRAAEDALRDGADVILGPLFSISVDAVVEAVDGDAPIIAFSNDPSVAGRGAYLMGLTTQNEVDRLINYAASQGLYRFAALVPDNQLGDIVIATAQESTAQLGAELTNWEIFAEGATAVDLSLPVEALANSSVFTPTDDTLARDLGYDAIILPAGGSQLLALGPILPRFDIDPRRIRFMGTSQWRDERLLNEPAFEGGWFVGADPVMLERFAASYRETYGDNPRRLASLAFDAVALAASLTLEFGPNGITPQILSNPTGFRGSNGLFRFREDGLTERALAVFEIRNGEFNVLEDAPFEFPVENPFGGF